MNQDEYADVFCIDCNGWRRQRLSGKNIYDGMLRYICTECGCENNVEDKEYKNMIDTLKNIGEKSMSESNISLTEYSEILKVLCNKYGEEKVKKRFRNEIIDL